MGMKASEVSDWLRQIAGKRDHREVMPDDEYVVIRPGPNFHWLMGSLDAGRPASRASEQGQSSNARREAGDQPG